MADSFDQVVIQFDKNQYAAGDKITMTISGQAVSDAGSTVNDTPAVTVKAADGTTTVINAGPIAIAVSATTNLDVVISSIDDGARSWIIAADGKTATATA